MASPNWDRSNDAAVAINDASLADVGSGRIRRTSRTKLQTSKPISSLIKKKKLCKVV